jgi:hypothetical protein
VSIDEVRDRVLDGRIARIDGADGPMGMTIKRIVLRDGTEFLFDWTRGSGRDVGLDVRRIAAEAPRIGRRRYVTQG